MIIYQSFDEIDIKGPVCLAMGNFDGVHPGHRSLIEKCVQVANERGWTPAVFTFSELTANAVSGSRAVKSLIPQAEKVRILEELGIKVMISVPFTKDIMELSAGDFIEKLVSRMELRHAVCGFNFRFGYKAQGTASFLSGMGMVFGFETRIVPEVRIGGKTVSSTLLRQTLAEGDLKAYSEYAEKDFYLTSDVLSLPKKGEKVLRFDISSDQALPPTGSYRMMYEGGSVSQLVSGVIASDDGVSSLYLDCDEPLPGMIENDGKLSLFRLEFV